MTHTDRVLDFNSNHADSAKEAGCARHMAKVKTHSALDDTQGKGQECKHVEEMLTANNPRTV